MADRVDVVRGVFEQWERGNYRAGLELYDPDLTLEVHVPIPDAAVFDGVAGLQHYMRNFLATWQDYEIHGVSFEAAGDSVVVEAHHRGRASGALVDARYFTAWTFEGERVVRMDIAQDRETALARA